MVKLTSLLLLITVYTTTAKNLRKPSESILDIINTQEVKRMLHERQTLPRSTNSYLSENELDVDNMPNESQDQPKNTFYDNLKQSVEPTAKERIGVHVLLNRSRTTQNIDFLSDLKSFSGPKILKSSKNALLVTKREYLKKDWCKTEPLMQKIREDGCLPANIINRFCYGQCNSFYIPKSPKRHMRHTIDFEDEDNDLIGASFKSCSVCKPKKFTWITITLRCPSQTPPFKKKRIQRIKQCKCTAGTFH